MIPLIAAGIGAAATLGGAAIQSYYSNKASEAELAAKKEAAQQMLQAIQAKEKETQEKVNKEKAALLNSRQKEKNW